LSYLAVISYLDALDSFRHFQQKIAIQELCFVAYQKYEGLVGLGKLLHFEDLRADSAKITKVEHKANVEEMNS